MNTQLLQPQNPAFQPEWASEDICIIFFKCVRWQVEETLDPINCPYHYFCDSTYPGNYPAYVDILVFLFAAASYLTTLVIMVIDILRKDGTSISRSKRFLLPSGPVSLPVILLMLSKGYRINTAFPLTCIGPAILQMLYISALAFDNGVDRDIKYAIYEASTISGILHASLYLDSIILPYYTGFDALVSSTFSGECDSCVCRKEVMVVGGRLVNYRGWSVTAFFVVAVLCLRIIQRMMGENRSKSSIITIKFMLETLGWIWITADCVYLIGKNPAEQSPLQIAGFVGVLVLICLHLIKKMSSHITRWNLVHEKLDG
ncbi:hypothetical protein JCGZ_25121 [Jatropha curcas]|uniref:Uncharacterized protein n=1 Tax=Jatropha curcas TaxID=180498 RepID=A0A067JKY2_JATCU|nr:uncharacterized protein LOC105646700 [Jatropha curcas]KDP24557.1 hypothetical protein JCGZ_25121 [Jatropha curcas]